MNESELLCCHYSIKLYKSRFELTDKAGLNFVLLENNHLPFVTLRESKGLFVTLNTFITLSVNCVKHLIILRFFAGACPE